MNVQEQQVDLESPMDLVEQVALLRLQSERLEREIQRRKALEQSLHQTLLEREAILTELRETLEQEREARVSAERRDMTKDEVLGIVGHDLRNPLHSIIATTQLMTMRTGLPDHVYAGFDRIRASAWRMQRMIEQLLDRARDRFSGGIPVALVEQPLVPIVEKIVCEARAMRPECVFELTFEPPEYARAENDCTVAVDADRLEQVIANLVENAVNHGDVGAPIRITVRAADEDVAIEVQNQGPPMDASVMPSLFDPFKRTSTPCRRSAGLGLGLYIADRIVHAHGGKIVVRSSVEDGTVFSVQLRRVQGAR